MFNFVKDFEVQEPNILSDHCLITFSFDLVIIGYKIRRLMNMSMCQISMCGITS